MGPQTARRVSVMCHVTAACFVTLMLVGHVTSQQQPSVKINSTSIYGNYKQVNGTQVAQFLGIRFGQSPTGALRFQKPRAAQVTGDHLNATQHGAPCASISLPGNLSSEDCLFLDVYVPAESFSSASGAAGPLPVMVWIYGGAFNFGYNAEPSYNGDILAAEGNVIVVSANYRLGPFGFLSTGDNYSPGNYGLWDQWLALKWVQDNIRFFGGDASNITLFGESAGGASVNYQMTSPQSVNLFQRAIMQSGNRLCPWAYNSSYSPLAVCNRVAATLNCSTAQHGEPDSSSRMITCLRNQSVDDLHAAGHAAALERGLAYVWTPVTDGDFVLPYDQRPPFAGSVMAGLNNHEGGLLVAMDLLFIFGGQQYNRTFLRDRILPVDVLKRMYYDLTLAADPQGLQHTVGLLDAAFRKSGSTHAQVAPEELITILSASEFWVSTQKWLDGGPTTGNTSFYYFHHCPDASGGQTGIDHAMHVLDSGPTTGNTFLYYFDHYPNATGGEAGMDHAMDVWYTFGTAPAWPIFSNPVPSAEVQLGKRFRTMLSNFAKTGDPNRPNDVSGWPTFPPYTKGDKSYLSVSTAPTVQSHLQEGLMTIFLDTVPALLQSQGQDQGQGQGCTSGATSLLPASAIPFLLVWTAAVLICAI